MPAVVWTPQALAALERHRQFLAETDPNIAVKAIQKIVEAGESLQTYPQKGTVVTESAGLRKLIVTFGKVGFVLHYTILKDEVLIVQIYHGRQKRPT